MRGKEAMKVGFLPVCLAGRGRRKRAKAVVEN